MLSRRTFLAGAATLAGHNLVPAAPKTPVAAAVAVLCPVTSSVWAQKTPDEILAGIKAMIARITEPYEDALADARTMQDWHDNRRDLAAAQIRSRQ